MTTGAARGLRGLHQRPTARALGVGTDSFVAAKPDGRLIKLLVRARPINATLVHSDGLPFAALAEREGVSQSYFTRKANGVKVSCPGQVPAMIAKFESTSAPVPLQCHPEVVRPHGHAELPR
jgi:hypothetical protein